ncbi:transposase [Kitasatospora sp. NPDC059571]|uniref:transposase n=1 Tax=Kitasatospora sp. NPDC059571 TaxID=3346871 RepID=UPI0036BA7D35
MSIMEGVGKERPYPRRSFMPEFKAEIVELCRRGDRSIGQVTEDFDLTETAVRDWVRQAEVDAGQRDGTPTPAELVMGPARGARRGPDGEHHRSLHRLTRQLGRPMRPCRPPA